MRALLLVAMLQIAVPYSAFAETLLERGEYLVRGPMGCGNCHTPMDANGFTALMELAGRVVEETAEYTAIAPNITPASRVSGWSDVELAKAIREGIRPDGSLIGPPMPFTFYRGIADDDLAAIVAFLRSLPAVTNDPGKSVYKVPLPPAYGPPVEKVVAPERGPTADYGKYLAGPIAHCMECHSPITQQGPDLTRLGQGGYEFHGPWGLSTAPNITSGEDGIAGYSDETLHVMITQGKRQDGTAMLPPMPYSFLALTTADDVSAIIAYLRTVPPLPDPK